MQEAGSAPGKPRETKVTNPLWLNAEITFRCPLHCLFCYNPVDYAQSGAELTTDEWVRALRQAREQHVQEQLLNRSGVPESQRQLAEFAADERVSRFEFVGVGHLTAADAFLAAQAAARAREYRQLAREELADRVA